MNWYLIIENTQQAAYYVERPRYTFRSKKKEIKHKILYQYQKQPIWIPINIELPIRILPETEKFINNKLINKLLLQYINEMEQVLEEWNIEKAEIINVQNKQSRIMNIPIINIMVKYNRAHKVK